MPRPGQKEKQRDRAQIFVILGKRGERRGRTPSKALFITVYERTGVLRSMRARFSSVSAFTLIEIVIALAVVIILTGIVVALTGHALNHSGRTRAVAEIALLRAAAESYAADRGQIPRDSAATSALSKTDRLSPKEHFIPASDEYEDASRFLYSELTGDRTGGPAGNPDGIPDEGEPRYLKEFDPRILKIAKGAGAGATEVKYLVDPFGYSYGYSTAAYADEQVYLTNLKTDGSAARNTGDSLRGFNVAGFDLWSTGGRKPGSQPNNPAEKNAEWGKWLKNW